MLKLIALFLILTGNGKLSQANVITIGSDPRHGVRIVGGNDAKIEDYPYQISLELNGSHNCGGSILSAVKILTAAHCTISYTIGTLRIRAGSTIREEGGQVLYLSKKVEHSQYDPQTVNNDIAVLILQKSLELNTKVKTIMISDVETYPQVLTELQPDGE
ncbi:hypothetical protein FQR65_LT02225 [Abscondita terminalis]|nr:hypothetical protein FQR65_LT02225 [Abscondita terminalis]